MGGRRAAIGARAALIFLALAIAPAALADQLLEVRTNTDPDRVRLVLELDGRTPVGVDLSDPSLLRLTLPRVSGRLPRTEGRAFLAVADLVIERVADGGIVIRVQLIKPSTLDERFWLPGNDGLTQRFVVDLTGLPPGTKPNLAVDPPATIPAEEALEAPVAEPLDESPPPAADAAADPDTDADTDTGAPDPADTSPSDPEPAPAVPGAEGFDLPPGFGDMPPGFGETPTDEAAQADGPVPGGFDFGGYAQFEVRGFPEPSFEAGPNRVNLSGALEPRFEYEFGNGRQSFTFVPFARFDSDDINRTHFDVREGNWTGQFGRFSATLGFDIVFWGVAESFHLVDIINQDDLLEDIDQEDKLGQPMVRLSYASRFGEITGFLLPFFRERRFPGELGRPRGPLLIERDLSSFEADNGDEHLDFAFRYKLSKGPFDIGINYFDGTARDPELIPVIDPELGVPVALAPRYELIRQVSTDTQATFDALLLKLEALYQFDVETGDFFGLVGGFEYTFFGAFGTDWDIGILGEYLFDDRGENTFSPFENDWFAGFRWTLNDTQDTNILGGVIVDLDTGASFFNLELSRRFLSNWQITLDARLLYNFDDSDLLFATSEDDFIQFRITRFF